MQIIDLRRAIHDVISDSSRTLAKNWLHLFTDKIDHLDPLVQIRMVNNFWRIELGRLPESTINEREYLTEDVSVDQWLRRFRKHIMPTVIKYNLPRGK